MLEMAPKRLQSNEWITKDLLLWNTFDVNCWLSNHRMDGEIVQKFEAHAIDGMALMLLSEEDLREMGLSKIGPRKRLLYVMSKLCQKEHNVKPLQNGDTLYLDSALVHRIGVTESATDSTKSLPSDHQRIEAVDTLVPTLAPIYLDPEPWKVVLSAIYVFFVFGIAAFVMVLAHERLPDMSKYPPLPDLLLDNLPHIPWAFEAAEMVGIVLLIIWCLILFFHRHRFILLRRFFSLTGTVFLLRCITMIITSLSVPGKHLHQQCQPYVFKNRDEKLARALEIWLGLGMSLQGVQTCGDYMFSGHTTCLTLLNFFITEYTPQRFYHLHTFSWILNIFGIFFILAGHEHYSIDVFVAFYISSRLFLYYHWLANNSSLMKRDKVRARIWFPLFTFFESKVSGVVPNEYEMPVLPYLSGERRIFGHDKRGRE